MERGVLVQRKANLITDDPEIPDQLGVLDVLTNHRMLNTMVENAPVLKKFRLNGNWKETTTVPGVLIAQKDLPKPFMLEEIPNANVVNQDHTLECQKTTFQLFAKAVNLKVR